MATKTYTMASKDEQWTSMMYGDATYLGLTKKSKPAPKPPRPLAVCACWIVPDFDRPATDQRTVCLACKRP